MHSRDLIPRTGPSDLTPYGRDPFSTFRREMDRLFDNFLTPMEPRSFGGFGGGDWPSVDVDETARAYTVTAELPGLDLKDVEVSLRENALTISGEKRDSHNEENGDRKYTERTYGRFARVIPLSAEIDAGKVEAGFKNGVLTVTLPKNPRAADQSRRIEIKAQ